MISWVRSLFEKRAVVDISVKRKYKKLTKYDKLAIYNLYRDGKSVKYLAEAYGAHRNTIYTVLKQVREN